VCLTLTYTARPDWLKCFIPSAAPEQLLPDAVLTLHVTAWHYHHLLCGHFNVESVACDIPLEVFVVASMSVATSRSRMYYVVVRLRKNDSYDELQVYIDLVGAWLPASKLYSDKVRPIAEI